MEVFRNISTSTNTTISNSLDFKSFIISLLNRRGNIKHSFCEKLTQEKYMQLWYNAFTHKTYDPINNYEYAEFIGDGIVNNCVSMYIVNWDSKIVSVKYLTRLKHNLTSKKQLAVLAEKDNFFKYIRLGDGDKKTPGLIYYRTIPKDELIFDKEYMSWLEDCFEAFIGTLSIVCNKEMVENKKFYGVGFEYCFQIMKSYIDDLKISLRYEDVFDPITRYKELCDKKWGFQGTTVTRQIKTENGRTLHTYEIYGFPKNDQSNKPENKVLLSKVTDKNKLLASYKAYEEAIRVLKLKYNIIDTPANPYKVFN